METRAQRTERLNEMAKKLTSSSNSDMLEIIKNNSLNMGNYECLIDAVDEPTADRMSYAMDIIRCELSGDTEHKFAPGAPRAWREHA